MEKWFKNIGIFIAMIFIVLFVVGYPSQSAATLKSVTSVIGSALWSVYDFFASFG